MEATNAKIVIMSQPVESLIQQAWELLSEIQAHPQVKHLEYSPDATIGDALQALVELQSEIDDSPMPEKYFVSANNPLSDEENNDGQTNP
jgi:hypothetical protein